MIQILSSAAMVTAVLVVLTYLCRKFLLQWIASSVQHSFDVKLENLRASHESELKRLSSALNAQQSLVAAAFLEARRTSNERRLIAIQTVWDAMMEFYRKVPPVVSMTDMLTNELYSDFLKQPSVKSTIPDFLKIGPQILSYEAEWALAVEKARLMCGEFLYALFFAYRALVGSITLDLSLSREKGVFQPWWNNEHIQSLLRSALLPEELREFTGLVVGRFTWLTRVLERKFLCAAEEIIDGRRAATDAFDQANSILAAAQDLLKSDRESVPDAQGQMSDPISASLRG